MTIIEELQEEIRQAQNKIVSIQNQCSHPPECVNRDRKSDTGNYDKSDDCYWIEYHCKLCDKQWSENQ